MIRSLAGRIPFSKVALMSLAVTAVGLNARAETGGSVLTEQDMEIVQQSKALSEKAREVEIPDWLNASSAKFNQAHQEARDLVSQLQRSNPTMKSMADEEKARERFSKDPVLIFASRSLGKQGLNDVLVAASQNPDSVVVFRGIPEHANLGEALLEIQNVAAELDPVPNVVINPVLFQEYNVTSVPTIIVREEQLNLTKELPEEIARVSGLVNPDWIQEQVDAGETGDFGARGPVEQISEPDLIELMKQRFANIDWEAQKENAKKNFWKKQTFRILAEAPEDRTREVDPTVVITQDILTPDGKVVARQGDRINPLEIRSFTQAVVVLDPLDEDQIERVKSRLPDIKRQPGVQSVTYIVTQLDRDEGWDSYTEVTDTFDAPVFLLTPDVKQRFELEYVPSIITADGTKFVVEELADREGDQ
ncbi:conjugal transfer protein TraW [Marinobacter sp. G11]|uniref:TrbC family F-type conjugative pilus assembly protein n=1 Tax=Marinobacter sp. G11 TaxID=2903522 RepID=UPI001E5A64A3|nr:TrbC family F-type conjugative pilus assembly protein [Marinobacter sp. G11]MCE0759510.1 conjugal transfer protein TraW [Marinobacter sp. G11]